MNTVQDRNTIDIINDSLSRGVSYGIYRDKVYELAIDGKTTGETQSKALIEYTQLNDRRMNRWDKTLKIPVEFQERIVSLDRKLTFLVLTESWCGDASPSLPVMNKIAELNPNIELRIVLRDENLDLMNQFLTNDAMSIPKLIILDQIKDEVIADWGPRPSIATKMVEAYKVEHGKLSPEFKQDLQVWYNKDKGQNILEDIVRLLPLE
ncbi:thioredoxin family protein [Croceitalea sp. MTPC9]|uniref:thioredoxin family protein n=1 Tax=unclassified Croceitalea TaxID=2632280 RepID=UPI002B3714F6|nr:thioredoxin family protein [Croceitalea sp. MTPC6]GMN16931.1 thioredoxin family protein [Croceitalea sp. MTPC9]